MSGRPRLLDLFCGAGGAARGYQLAGFHVTGVDIKPQPRYAGDALVQADALRPPFDLSSFDAIHASPPCQAYSTLAAMHPDRDYPDLIDSTRAMLVSAGVPWIIENVEPAPLNRSSTLFGEHGVMLCGSMFGLGVERGYLRRHRVFETSFPVAQPSCAHRGNAVGVYGHGGHSGKHRMLYRAEAATALDIDWMSRDEMTQAIPPAFTEFIGRALLTALLPSPDPINPMKMNRE